MTGPASTAPGATSRPWYRRRSILVAAGVIAIGAITVITDLPQHASRPAEIAGDTSVMSQVNSDVGPCSYALGETFLIYSDLKARMLSASDVALAPRLLSDDQSACSFTDDSIYQLANIEVPGSAAGKRLGQLVSTVTLWATSDALSAIEDVQILYSNQADAAALTKLGRDEQMLRHDKAQAEAELAHADKVLATRLPPLKLTDAPS